MEHLPFLLLGWQSFARYLSTVSRASRFVSWSMSALESSVWGYQIGNFTYDWLQRKSLPIKERKINWLSHMIGNFKLPWIGDSWISGLGFAAEFLTNLLIHNFPCSVLCGFIFIPILLVLNAGNFREWMIPVITSNVIIPPRATHPATLRKTHQ